MKNKKKWLKTVPFAVLAVGALAGAAACHNTPSIPVDPVDGPEVGEYYYDYSDNVEYIVNLGSGNTVSVTIDGKQGNGVYTLVNNTLTFVLEDGTSMTMSAVWNNDELTLQYNNMTFIKKVDYTVTFDTAGGSHIDPAIVRNGRRLSKPATPTRKGFHFIGWHLSGSTEKFVFGNPVTGNMTLVAEWEVAIPEDEEVNIAFDLGYGASTDTLRTTNRRADGLPVPEREGYTFAGWWASHFENKSELTYKVEEGDEFYADTTLYAIWLKDGEVNAPALSVDSSGVTWNKQTMQGTLSISGPEGFNSILNKPIGATADNFEPVDFKNAPAGKYTVTFTVGGLSVTRYYNNKGLDRVYKFSVDNGNILRFNSVRGENVTYIVTIDCGDDNHDNYVSETERYHMIDTKGSTSYDFSNCAMQKDGIVFTVVARAEGCADSVATSFTYKNLLDKVSGFERDAETDILDWDTLENASSYIVSVKVNNEIVVDNLDIGNKNSFDLKPYTGKIEVSVYAKTLGYVSPEAAVFSYEKTALATPSNLRIVGDILSWDGAEADGVTYKVSVGGKDFAVSETQINLTECDVDWTKGSGYSITVQAIGANSSFVSEPFDARYYAMGQTMSYNRNTVTWVPVIGAQSYEVKVNGVEDNVKIVSDGSNRAEIVLTQEGINTVSVRFFDGNEYSEWVDLSVTAYEMTLNLCNGADEVKLYYAAGDKITLPDNYTYDGHDFNGWYDVEGGGAVMGRKFIDEYFTANQNIDVYLYWTNHVYEVNLDFGEYGTLESRKADITYTQNYSLPVPQVTDGRKVFKGWSANRRGTNMITDNNGVSKGPWNITIENYTLYAIYSDGCAFSNITLNGTEGYLVTKGDDINDIRELYIPSTYDDGVHGELPVIYIPDGAFERCTTLTSVSIPDTVVSIDGTAFSGCTKITGYNVRPAGNTEPKLLSVDGTLIEIGRTGSYDLKAIPSVIEGGVYTVPDRVTKLPIGAFRNIYSLKEVIVPASVSRVEQGAFDGCSSLTTISFLDAKAGEEPEALSVSVDFVKSCSSVTTINFPKHLGVFDESSKTLASSLNTLYNLETINVTRGGNYFAIDGVLCQTINEDGSNINYLKYCPVTKSGTYTVPANIHKIAAYAFANTAEITAGVPATSRINNITDLIVHAGVMSVGDRAFYGNRNLKTVTFLADKDFSLPKTIGYQAFYYCDSLVTLDMQEEGELKQNSGVWYFEATAKSNITAIGEDAFYKTAITSVTLSSTLTTVGKNAFRSCEKLSELDLSHVNSALSFGDTVFNGCSSLTEVEITKNVGEVAFGSVFYNCANLKGFEIDPNSPYYSTDDYGVVYNKAVTSVLYVPDGFVGNNGAYVLPDTVTRIVSGVFSGKRGIQNITISGSVTTIGEYAFENCISLSSVTFVDGEEDLTIGNNAFAGCFRLLEINLPKNTRTLGEKAFYGLVLKKITLNEGLETIGKEAFSTSGIASIEIPYTVTFIGDGAFARCASLVTLTFAETPDDKTAVSLIAGEQAFASTSLSDVKLPERLQYVSKSMFRNCSVLKTVEISSTVGNTVIENEKFVAIGDEAFYGCLNLTGITFAEYTGSAVDMKTVSFGKQVFYDCTMLKTLDLPARVGAFTESGMDLFAMYTGSDFVGAFNVTFNSEIDTTRSHAAGINAINIDGEGGDFVSKDGIVYTKGFERVLFCPYYKAGSVEIDYRAATFAPNAFRFCKDVTEITFEATPDGVKKVDFVIGDAYLVDSASKEMPDLTEASRNPIVNNKGTFVFQGCTSLETIVFPARLKSIGDYAFTNNMYNSAVYGNALKYVSFEEGCELKTIGKHAFDATVLVSIDLPANLETLGEGVFDNCARLKSITLSNTMGTEVLEKIIAEIPTLTNITIPDDNPNFAFDDGVIYNKDKTALLYVLASKDSETYILPDSVTRIATRAFAKSTLVKNVVISANEDGSANLEIAERAFEDSGITSISLSSRVESIGEYVFNNSKSLTRVSFENWDTNSCIELPDAMFYGCTSLKSIAIPSTVTTLGNYIFYGCNSLVTATFEDAENSSLTMIGTYAFAGCSALKEIALPKNVTSLGAEFVSEKGVNVTTEGYTFQGCSSLTKITLSDKIEYIGTYAFENCSALVSVNLPLEMKALGGYAFMGCSALKGLTFNPGTPKWQTMGQYVFSGCTSLESITFPQSVKHVNTYLTQGCNALKTVTFEGGCEINSSFKNLPNLETVIFKDNGVEAKIGSNSFEDCIKLKNVTLSDNVTYIGNSAFVRCTSLVSIDIPANVVYLMGSAFKDCTGLTTVNYNAVYKEAKEGEEPVGAFIGADAFNGCTSLANFNFKTDENGDIVSNINLESIARSAFTGCTSLTNFVMPDSVRFIADKIDYAGSVPYAVPITEITTGTGAIFAGTSLKTVTLSKNLTVLPTDFFYNIKTLTTVDFNGNDQMTIIGNRVFEGTSITSISLPATVTEIGANVFRGCTSLTNFEINLKEEMAGDTAVEVSYLAKIGEYAFSGCTGLTSIDLSATEITAIANRLFYNCTALTEVKLPTGIETVGDYAFNSSKISSITFDKALTSIGLRAFENCSLLVEADISGTALNNLGNYAFSGTGIASVELPATLKSLGEGVFKNCTLLTDVKFNEVTEIGAYAFQGCAALVGSADGGEGETIGDATVYIDISKVTNIGQYAFNGCTSLAAIKIAAIKRVETGAFTNTSLNLQFITAVGLKFENNILCNVSSEEGVTAVLYVGTDEVVTVPDSVVNIGDNLFSGNTTVTEVRLPSTVRNIGAGAFNGCTNLTKINLDNVEILGNNAFNGCTKLSKINADDETYLLNSLATVGSSAFKGTSIVNITMPAVTTIAVSAFENCKSLDTVTINGTEDCQFTGANVFKNSTLRVIDMSAVTVTSTTFESLTTLETVKLGRLKILITGLFKNCSNLSTVNFDGVEDIRMEVFRNCTSLTKVEFDGNTIVDNNFTYAFAGCTSLHTVVLKGVKRLGGYSFQGCTALKNVDFGGNTLKNLGSYSFQGCTALEEITLPSSLNAWGFGYTGSTQQPNGPYTGDTAPTSTSAQNTSMFMGCTSLHTVTFTGGAAYLGSNAFSGCTSLKNVDLTGITVVGWLGKTTLSGDGMFKGCTALESIDLKNVTYIGANAFNGCKALKSVTNNNNVTRIGGSAFLNCELLNNVSFPALTGTGTTGLGASAFEGCKSLESFTFPATLTGTTGANMFKGCTSLKSVTIERYTGTAFAASFFEGCSSLTSFTMPASVTAISSKMFAGCGALKDVDLTGSKATTLSSNAFLDCTGLETIHIPSGIKEITATAFKGCASLKNVIFDGTSVNKISSNAFEDCTSLASIDLSNQPLDNNMTSYVATDYAKYGIMANAFKGCTALQEVKVGNIATLDTAAFTNCGDFTVDDVTWTKGGIVTEEGATYNVSAKVLLSYSGNAESFKVRDGITSIANEVFKDNESLVSIDLNGVTSISSSAFENCTSLTSVDLSKITSFPMGNNSQNIFKGCTSLKEAVLPGASGVYIGGANMFEGCTSLDTISWTESPTKLPSAMFKGCSSLKTFDFSKLTDFSANLFEGTGFTEINVSNIALNGSVTGVFKDCKSLTKATINGKFTTLTNAPSMFEGCGELVEFHAPSVPATGSTAVPASMFKDCVKLATFDVAGIQTINNNAFQNCSSLSKWTIGNTTSVGQYAFDGCTNLTSFDFTNVTTVNDYAFRGTALSGDLELGKATGIKQYAFAGLAITSVTANAVATTALGASAFANCTSLNTVTMKNATNGTGLTQGVSAFAGCTALTTVDMPKLRSIGNMMFDGCTALSSLNASSSVWYLGQYAFRNCTALKEVTFSYSFNKSNIKGDAFAGWTAEQTINLTGISSNNLNAADLNLLKACEATVNLKDIKPLV